jgi:signal peptidase II
VLSEILLTVFYGVIFDDSQHQPPLQINLMELGSRKVVGYVLLSFWHGKSWLPIWAEKIYFFNAIFNIADMAISTGV